MTEISFSADNVADVTNHPGWKTQYQMVVPNITMKYDRDIFYGLGNCPRKKLSLKEHQEANTANELIAYYTTLLRTGCITRHQEYFLKLIDEGYMRLNGKEFKISSKCKYT